MNKRNFLKTGLVGGLFSIVTPSVIAKPDKYQDPNYGHTFKTQDSVFTVREIEMMCREWGWIHVENFVPFFKDHQPPYFICREGVGKFVGVDGNNYHMWVTFRTQWYSVSPYHPHEKREFKTFLKKIAGDYYGRNREHYYFYDVLMPRDQYYVHDAYKDIATGEKIENPSKESMEVHGKRFHNVYLHHLGVTDGKSWGTKS